MKALLLLLLVCPFLNATANTYYFSSVSGDDSRSSSQAQSPSTPWRSLSKLNSFSSSLQPGDKVLLKRGETFYGSITIKKSGTSSSPIFIGAFGSGNKPVITSLQSITSWVSKGGGIYESANAISGTRVKVVLLNGVQQELGRYPNSNTSNGGFLTFESHSGTTSITDNQLTSSPNWTGADVVIRKRRWVIDRDLITSHSGTTITYKPSASYVYTPSDKFGYFIENSIKTLDRLGEWYYNTSTKKLSVYFGSNSPSSYSVKVPTVDDLLYSESTSYLTFDNLNITGANLNTLELKSTSHLSVTNCDISFGSETGIKAFTSSSFKVEGCTIDNCNTNGIDLGYSGDNATIRNTKITNTFTFSGMSASGDGKGMAIHCNGSGATIEYNEIRNCGFEGINFGGSNTTIKNNYIDKFCYIKDDGGAIYTYGGPGTDIPYVSNRKVTGNIIMNGLGALNGAYNPYNTSAEAIYLDNGSMNVEVTGNTVFNISDMALYLHNAKNIKVSGNTFYAPDFRKIGLLESANRPLIRGNSISNNIFFTKSRGEGFIYRKSEAGSSLGSFGTISGNYYASLLDDNTATLHTKVKAYDGSPVFKDYTTAIRYEYNPTQQTKTVALDATYVDAKNVSYSGSITLQPYACAILLKTGSGGTTTSTYPTVSLTSPVANASYKANATVTISADAADADGSITKVEFYKGTTLLHTETVYPYIWDWTNVPSGSYTITAKAIDNSGKSTTSTGVKISVLAARDVLNNNISAVVNSDDSSRISNLIGNETDNSPVTFNLFPNPAIYQVQLNLSHSLNNKKGTISIVNMAGSLTRNVPVTLSGKMVSVDVSSLSSGTYVLTLKYDNVITSKKFIKIN